MRRRYIEDIELTSGGGTINLDVTETFDSYRIFSSGSVTLTSNWTIQHSGTPVKADLFEIVYEADVDLDGNTITLLGTTMPTEYTNKRVIITAEYNGTAWVVVYKPDFNQANIISSTNLLPNAVDASSIADASITKAKLENVTRGSVLVGDASNRPVELDLSTDAAIPIGNGTDVNPVVPSGDVTIDNAGVTTIGNTKVTKDKLENVTEGSVLVGDASNRPVELDLSVNTAIPIGNGTTVAPKVISGDGVLFNNGELRVYTTSAQIFGADRHEGGLRIKTLSGAFIKGLLDGTTNNLFSVNDEDFILKIDLWVQTASGVVATIECGPDATARSLGADSDGILKSADSNAAGVYASDNPAGTYMGALQLFGGFRVDDDGYITIKSSADLSSSAIVCGATMWYIPK